MENVYKLYINDSLDSITSEQLEQAIATLPEWRREKALRFKHEQGRKECAFSYLLLCQALRDAYGITQPPAFSIGPHGKPTLTDYPHIHFNLSHCRQAVACVVADHPVGVDVESIGRYSEPLARHVLNDREVAHVLQAADPSLAFIRYWTQKEAIVKLTGRGIDDDLRHLLDKHPHISLHTEEHPQQGYVLTVAL